MLTTCSDTRILIRLLSPDPLRGGGTGILTLGYLLELVPSTWLCLKSYTNYYVAGSYSVSFAPLLGLVLLLPGNLFTPVSIDLLYRC